MHQTTRKVCIIYALVGANKGVDLSIDCYHMGCDGLSAQVSHIDQSHQKRQFSHYGSGSALTDLLNQDLCSECGSK